MLQIVNGFWFYPSTGADVGFRAVDITAKAGIPDSLKDGRKRAPVQPFGVRGLVTALGQDF
ncbi:MAG TPA: hypothetical protein VKB46_17135 [Pyrinomonadaceae bacterium]|nr:hypothetical protein [Pyrinomonadaceae bacterium]